MGLFSKKLNLEELSEELQSYILSGCAGIAEEILNDQPKSIEAGVEVLYFYLNILDREINKVFSKSKGDELFNKTLTKCIYTTAKVVIDPDASPQILTSVSKTMFDTFNNRQFVYSRCKSVSGSPFPSIGTMIFALCFYIHRELGKTSRTNVDAILIGEKKMDKNDLSDFPEPSFNIETQAYILSYISFMKLPKLLKRLR